MKKIILSIVILAATSNISFAYFGARPMGMGGAFTAIADDANAPYWNPAGLALNPGVDITGSTLTTNRNAVIGDNFLSAKMCYEARLSSPFEWILGIGALSGFAMNAAQTLGDMGVLKKNWGRDVEKTDRDASMADQVKESGDNKDQSINPFKRATPKPGIVTAPVLFPFSNIEFNFYPHNNSYWYDRWENPDQKDTPQNKAQFAFGLSWYNDNNPMLDEISNWYTLSVASGWEERVAIGANLNLYNMQIISNSVKGFGAGIDIGAIAKPLNNVSFGLVAKEILTTDINWQNGAATRYDMTINAGVAVKPVDKLTIAADADNVFGQNNETATMHYGIEVRPVNGIALRTGLYDGSKTAGASIGVGGLIVDYAYLGGAFNRTQMIGATWKF